MAYLLTKTQAGVRGRVSIPGVSDPSGVVTIGRAADVDVRIDDRSVSKQHAELQSLPGGRFRLVDLGSSNGLFVGRRRERDVVVEAGAPFRLGQVTCVVAGVGDETFPIPESVPRPSADGVAEPAFASQSLHGDFPTPSGSDGSVSDSIASGRDLWSSRERRIALAVVAMLLGVAGAAIGWNRWGSGSSSQELSTEKSDGSKDPSRGVGFSPGDSPNGDLPNGSSSRTDPMTTGVGSLESSGWVDAWRQVGQALDQRCAGCHLDQPRLRFHAESTSSPESPTSPGHALSQASRSSPGRWEENLRWVRSNLVAGEEWLELGAFGSKPHDQPMALLSRDDLAVGLESLLETPTQLFPAPLTFGESNLDIWSSRAAIAYRSFSLATRGRIPTLSEVEFAATVERDRWVSQLDETPAAWRWQTRNWVRGSDRFPASGAFLVPIDTDQGASHPEAWKRWVQSLDPKKPVDDIGVRTPVEFAMSSSFPSFGAASSLSADSLLISAATFLWGRAPTLDEHRDLWRVLVEGRRLGLTTREVVEATLDLLLFSPANRYPSPPAGQADSWLAWTSRAIKGSGWTAYESKVLVEQLPRVDFRQVLRILWLDKLELDSESLAPKGVSRPDNSEARPVPVLRAEVWCTASLSSLFEKPDRLPHWWSRMDRARVHWYPAEKISLAERFRTLAAASGQTDELMVVDGLLTSDLWSSSARVLRADGSLLPAWRQLSDRIGLPRGYVPLEQDEALRRDLGRPARGTRSREKALAALGRAGRGYLTTTATQRALTPNWLSTLELAREALRRNENVSAWFVLTADPSSDPERWESFSSYLESAYSSHEVDLWFWYAENDTVRCLRVGYAPTIARGWIQHEEQPVTVLHPQLSKEAK